MKKYLSILLVVTMIFTMCGCSMLSKKETVTEPTTTTETPIENVITKTKWIKTAPAGNEITLKFKKNGTGWESYDVDDIEDSEITWKKMGKDTVKVEYTMDNGKTTAILKLIRDNENYSLQIIEENDKMLQNPEEHTYLPK